MFILKFKTAARTFLEFGALPAIADRYAEGGRLLGSQELVAGLAAREGRFDYLLVEPLPAAEPRLGRRTALSLPLFPPPQ